MAKSEAVAAAAVNALSLVPGQSDRVKAAKAWAKARRLREAALGAQLFADPAWDMLLDLYVAHHEQKTTSIADLCVAAYVPPTTALRWVERLEREGLIVRTRDRSDRRRLFVTVQPDVLARLDEVFTGFIRICRLSEAHAVAAARPR